ncbi:hypothetical protein INR49_027297, partial [Caranx melampygus]
VFVVLFDFSAFSFLTTSFFGGTSLPHSPRRPRSRLVGDLPPLVFAFYRRCEGERGLDEVQREDAHVSIKAVLCHLQRPAAGTRHQLLLLQNEDVVGFLTRLEGSEHGRTKDGSCLQLAVVLLFPGVNDQGDMAAIVGGKLPKCPDDVVLDCKPGSDETIIYFHICHR